MHTRKDDDSIITEGWIGDKLCIMTIDAGASVMIARPHITTGFSERQLTRHTSCRWLQGRHFPS
jgi:hypothetical protein